MPWQQHVADIAGEVDPKSGLPIYREVILLVPRQSGKTTFLLSSVVHRAFAFGRPQNTRYAAQTGDDAIAKWKEHIEILSETPLRKHFRTDDTNGQKALIWANGSRYTPTATTKKSGHGKTLDQGIIDEAFAQIDFRTEQAMRPAMITRRDAQLFVVSTAGDATSIFLNSKIAANRERLQEEPDRPSRIAYLEWSAPEGVDVDDEDWWWRCMPALGRTQHIDEVRAELEGMEGGEREFRRAYLNQTDLGATAEQVFSHDDWVATGTNHSWITGPRAFALDITNDRAWASVSWAGKNVDGFDHHEVIKHERGTHWIIQFLHEKLARSTTNTVAVVAGSQAALMVDDLEKAGIDVLILSRADYAAGCASYHDGIINRTSRHLAQGQLPLDIAIGGAAWSTSDARVWSRTKSTVDISPLVSCTAAKWAYVIAQANEYTVEESIA
jgi:Phage Terminase